MPRVIQHRRSAQSNLPSANESVEKPVNTAKEANEGIGIGTAADKKIGKEKADKPKADLLEAEARPMDMGKERADDIPTGGKEYVDEQAKAGFDEKLPRTGRKGKFTKSASLGDKESLQIAPPPEKQSRISGPTGVASATAAGYSLRNKADRKSETGR